MTGTKAGITVVEDGLTINGICFTHDKNGCKPDATTEIRYTISGHVHPGVVVRGLGKQSLSFPCFYFGEDYAVLPAFSRFTGTYNVRPQPGDNVFAIADDCVIKIKV